MAANPKNKRHGFGDLPVTLGNECAWTSQAVWYYIDRPCSRGTSESRSTYIYIYLCGALAFQVSVCIDSQLYITVIYIALKICIPFWSPGLPHLDFHWFSVKLLLNTLSIYIYIYIIWSPGLQGGEVNSGQGLYIFWQRGTPRGKLLGRKDSSCQRVPRGQ